MLRGKAGQGFIPLARGERLQGVSDRFGDGLHSRRRCGGKERIEAGPELRAEEHPATEREQREIQQQPRRHFERDGKADAKLHSRRGSTSM